LDLGFGVAFCGVLAFFAGDLAFFGGDFAFLDEL
jgi:hypothetical protein